MARRYGAKQQSVTRVARQHDPAYGGGSGSVRAAQLLAGLSVVWWRAGRGRAGVLPRPACRAALRPSAGIPAAADVLLLCLPQEGAAYAELMARAGEVRQEWRGPRAADIGHGLPGGLAGRGGACTVRGGGPAPPLLAAWPAACEPATPCPAHRGVDDFLACAAYTLPPPRHVPCSGGQAGAGAREPAAGPGGRRAARCPWWWWWWWWVRGGGGGTPAGGARPVRWVPGPAAGHSCWHPSVVSWPPPPCSCWTASAARLSRSRPWARCGAATWLGGREGLVDGRGREARLRAWKAAPCGATGLHSLPSLPPPLPLLRRCTASWLARLRAWTACTTAPPPRTTSWAR